ncbi:MAG TPA: aspartate carbamoyltransferase catalytic subunit [Candidatus Hydrothermia bacterium]|nr:aspartate carbamoyltransferase catalytic subunit [Candidatus Hydrothermae bacterium]MDD5572462.1 aspartate carbamoyltransferase catalytic subunit [Candidatus Hydrothermia bacterium]HOK23399.1 aspartate carbamoyltransferase catalytic subunit [Candidatus Hydrothermia bacterium]HOL24209.1 aspartate carbamoyltransferase catalytic subunit [Candidatus Hydrothermia bacterium]HPO79066.1 aspartate carbamoyltransferase catalytic subunit [Candidatus Hydrothermia bacterium]
MDSQSLTKKDLLGLNELDREEIELILDTARSLREILYRPIKKVPTLRGKTVVNMFFEPSTRTQSSFDLAAKRLSADTVSVSTRGSAVQKGESLLDTLLNIDAMKADAFVIRHWASGAPHFLARYTKAAVINAGDGTHEHPTQALLDILTMQDRFGSIEGLDVLIVGDILHSRVARSNIFGLKKLGAKVTLSGPPTLLPEYFQDLGADISYDVDEAVKDKDVIMALRIQKERLEEAYFPSIREYRKFFGITIERLRKAKENAVIMHPGPVNWGVELDFDLLQERESLILNQVTNGVAVRMAVLYLFIKGEKES